jgi:hypothetical protein
MRCDCTLVFLKYKAFVIVTYMLSLHNRDLHVNSQQVTTVDTRRVLIAVAFTIAYCIRNPNEI